MVISNYKLKIKLLRLIGNITAVMFKSYTHLNCNRPGYIGQLRANFQLNWHGSNNIYCKTYNPEVFKQMLYHLENLNKKIS